MDLLVFLDILSVSVSLFCMAGKLCFDGEFLIDREFINAQK